MRLGMGEKRRGEGDGVQCTTAAAVGNPFDASMEAAAHVLNRCRNGN